MWGNAKIELADADVGALRVAPVRPHRLFVTRLRGLWTDWLGARRNRCLASLSDRQLKDAGIDLAEAGRGRAAAACLDPNLEGLR